MEVRRLSLVWLEDIRVIFFMENPSEIVMDPNLQLIQASVVASHGLPRINGCPPSYDLGYKTKNCVGYYHESIETTNSSKIHYGLILDLSTISNMVGVGLR